MWWGLLTDEKAKSKSVEETGNAKNVDSSNNITKNWSKNWLVPYQAALPEKDGPCVSQNQIVNIAPGEENIPVSFSWEPNWEALTFPKEYASGKNHINEARVVPITPYKSIYMQG